MAQNFGQDKHNPFTKIDNGKDSLRGYEACELTRDAQEGSTQGTGKGMANHSEEQHLWVKLKISCPEKNDIKDQPPNDFISDSNESRTRPVAKASFKTSKNWKAKQKALDPSEDSHSQDDSEDDLGVDDGEISYFESRVKKWARNRRRLRFRNQLSSAALQEESDPLISEIYLPHPFYEDAVLESQVRIPGDIFNKLFDYQKDGIRWLWNLHKQNEGGILGDDMGLGKTVQMIGFLATLHYSKESRGPTIIICPATLMYQWVKEIHEWWAPLRVAILHSSGIAVSSHDDADKSALKLIRTFCGKGSGHILITTYETVKKYSKPLLSRQWEYVVLDEGHKIRNPDSEVTLTVKEFKSAHRIILSGTPIQNNYKELWSLMDFVAPGRFGTLPVFEEHLASRVIAGGYRHATEFEVQAAYYCARAMAEFVQPYMLRRTKADVAIRRPKQTDQVLFCKLTQYQRELYEEYLKKREMMEIVNCKKLQNKNRVNFVWAQITKLSKICNHPDLYLCDHDPSFKNSPEYGHHQISGKMAVVKTLLEMWHPNGHRVLLFSQSTEMLDILEKFVLSSQYDYRRLDGSTPITKRSFLVDEFNHDTSIFLLLVTTKVGGVGLNLTGADRIIIYDPDWNPSNDDQATERAARPGQKKRVAIYRLMTSGTIEEKIYHRQLFKRMISKKITKKPSKNDLQFEAGELYDLFSLGDPDAPETDTSYMFGEAEVEFEESDSTKRRNISSRIWDRFLNETVERNNSRFPSQKSKNPTSSSNILFPNFKKRKTTDSGQSDDLKQVETSKNDISFSLSKPLPKKREGETSSRRPAIEDISEIAKVEEWKSGIEQDEQEEEVCLIQNLLKTNGLHSVFKHDKVLDAKSSSSSTYQALVDKKARETAEEARAALESSRRRLKSLPLGTLTWTGQYGKGGAHDDQFAQRKSNPWDFSQYKRF
ncbi:hypothetical protein G9A89_015597 [Geosiphon pyriformis]|nr:hypothetical protein G9A89_015597 [Geosiphon pyriformis]